LILKLENKNIYLLEEYCWWVNKYFRCWAKTPSGSIWEQMSVIFFLRFFGIFLAMTEVIIELRAP